VALTRGRLLTAVALIVVLPAALWVIWRVQRDLPLCDATAAQEAAYEDGAIGAHAAASGLLLATAAWAGALRARLLVPVAAYAVLCLLVEEAWLPVAVVGFALALQGVGLVLIGLTALLLAYAVAHPRALQAPSRRLDHARMLVVLCVLAAIGVQGELALVLTGRACS
jgi:hypothetical protein